VAFTWNGFLVYEEAPKFRVFSTDLSTFEGVTTEVPGKPWDRVGYERIDLEPFVKAALDAVEAQGPEIPWFDKIDPFGAHHWSIPNQAFRIAVLARACHARGLDTLAHRLCDRARFEQTRPSMTQQYGLDDSTERASFDAVKAAIRAEAYHVFEESFGDPKRSWEDLLADAERLARAFAPDLLRDDGDGDVALLRRIVAARRATDAGPPTPTPLAEPDRAAEEVEGLVEASGRFYSTWGLWSPPPDEARPAQAFHRLEEMGFAAVPALIDALDDVRFTRAVELTETGKGQYRPPVRVLRVGDLAWRVLDRMSGSALTSRRVGGPPTSREPTRRRAAIEWFEKAKARGEVALLSDEVVSAGPSAADAASRLAKLAPDVAVSAIEKGITAADADGNDRERLVGVLSSIDSDASTSALLRLLEPLEGSSAGIQAASVLWQRGRRAGLDELVRRWKAGGPASGFGFWGLAEQLVATRHLDAIRAIEEDLRSRPVYDRVHVVYRLFPADESVPGTSQPSPEWDRAVEGLLGSLLEDGGRAKGLYVGSDPVGKEPVVGQVALLALSRRQPGRWSFDPKAPAKEREAARIAAANAWRAARGLEPVVRPKRTPPTPLALASIRDLVDRALDAPDAAQREQALASLGDLGLPAVPALRQAVSAASADAPGRAEVERLARRLSFTVSEVVLPESEGLDPTVLDALRAARGKILSDALWGDLWRAFVLSESPSGGLRLSAERETPDVGVRLVATRSADRSWVFNSEPGVTTRFPDIRQGDRRGLVRGNSWTDLESAARRGAFGGFGLDVEIERADWDEPFEADGDVYVER
jgi:hypothetical protein